MLHHNRIRRQNDLKKLPEIRVRSGAASIALRTCRPLRGENPM